MSHGFVRAEHGVLPVPAPAVVEVLSGVPTYGVDVAAELVTPTGACLVRSNASAFARWPSMRPIATGFGAGTRTLPGGRPNVLRVVLGDPDTADSTERPAGTHAVLEVNLDDSTGQVAAHVTDTLLREGALDAWTTPPRSAQRILLFDQTYLPNQNDPETTRKVLGYARRAVPKILAELNKLGL